MQIYADVCGVPFLVTSDHSVALGAAILTAYALGWHPSIPEAADAMVRCRGSCSRTRRPERCTTRASAATRGCTAA